jgi:hypothetical protein
LFEEEIKNHKQLLNNLFSVNYKCLWCNAREEDDKLCRDCYRKFPKQIDKEVANIILAYM